MRIRLDLTYDGTDFFGWQKQRGKRTVAGTVEDAIKKVLGAEVVLKGASRTDRGVHALCLSVHFDVAASHIPPEKLAAALNMELPPDVKIMKSAEAPETFHARLSAKAKIYEYKILVAETPPPLFRRTHCVITPPFNPQKAADCLQYIIGTHDFTSFCYVDKTEKDKTRTITAARIINNGDEYVLEISGNGFLHNMVRIIAGTIIKIAKNAKCSPADIKRILEARDRQKAASTAPACGLYLKEIIY